MLKKLSAIILVLAMIFSLAACGSSNKETTAKTESAASESKKAETKSQEKTETKAAAKSDKYDYDSLTVAYRSEAANLDPHNNQSLTAMSLEMLVYDRLVDKDENGNITPSLATSWEVIDDLTVRFHLRDDVYFSNGDKLTAEDVKYTIERASTMPNSMSFMGAFDGEGTAVVDEKTVDIKLKRAFAPIYNYLSSARGSIVNKKEMEKVGSDAYGRNPVGTGAFIFESWTAGDKITMTRNEKYWGNKPEFSKFTARFISESASRAMELESNGIDISLYIDATDADRLSSNPQTQIFTGPSYSMTFLCMNIAKVPALKDVKVREALYKALNLKAIEKAAYGNSASVGTSVISSSIWSHVDCAGANDYDKDAAKKMLDEAGFDYNTEFEIMISDDATITSICEMVCNMWGQIGVKAKVNSYDSATLSDKIMAGEYQMTVSAASASSGDPDHALYEWKSEAHGFEVPAELSDLIVKGAAAYDSEERAKIYAEFQKKAWDYHSEIIFAYTNVIYGATAKIATMDAHPGNVPNFAKVTFAK